MTQRLVDPAQLNRVCARPPVVLLESAGGNDPANRTYLFLRPERIITARNARELRPALRAVHEASRTHWVAGFISYEAGFALEPRLYPLINRRSQTPLLWFGVYNRPIAAPREPKSLSFAQAPGIPRPDIEQREFTRAFQRIKRYIAAGDTYQVNYTFDLHLRSDAPLAALYARLRESQPVPYSALIDTGDTRILSFSPELFFDKRGDQITVMPMKGTAPRENGAARDRQAARALAHDPKNRAENVMIVDLLRNDLGKICRTGTVRTGPLFSVETHPTLHQMTSTVRGTLRPDITFERLIEALFPCGSVTGAPKIRAMEIIHELEHGKRGVYCGAIGYISPRGRATFSVAIRTLQSERAPGVWRFRAGSGIVWDSRAESEWHECLLKAAFLTRETRQFELLETLYWNRRPLYLREHLRRLRSSCRSLGFAYDSAAIQRALRNITRSLRVTAGPHRVRILLNRDGRVRWESTPITPSATAATALYLSRETVDSGEKLLRHKTTFRPWYTNAMHAVTAGRCVDIVCVNEHGVITEGARSNVFARIDGVLYTPPLSAGLLPGVLRARLLARGACRERALTPRDLERAEQVYCGNSVRGLIPVVYKGLAPRNITGAKVSQTTRRRQPPRKVRTRP